MNPFNGPESTVNSDYTTAVTNVQASGVSVIGYVRTNYSNRAIADVMTDIDTYYSQYPINGIFLDETSTDVAKLDYYKQAADYVYAKGPSNTVTLNPGQTTAEEYISIANSTVTFENSMDRYVNHWVAPSYMDSYPSHKFVHMIYAVETEEDLEQVARLSHERNAGYVFITEDLYPNPYDIIPKYINEEAAMLGTCDYSTSSSSEKALSDGAIAGIVIGGVAFVCIVAAAVYYVVFAGSSGSTASKGKRELVSPGDTNA